MLLNIIKDRLKMRDMQNNFAIIAFVVYFFLQFILPSGLTDKSFFHPFQ
jgi:hypothetical protein